MFPFPLFRFQDANDLTPSSIQPAVSFGFSVPVASNKESIMFGRVALRDCELSKVLRLESVLSLEESVLELAPKNKF